MTPIPSHRDNRILSSEQELQFKQASSIIRFWYFPFLPRLTLQSDADSCYSRSVASDTVDVS